VGVCRALNAARQLMQTEHLLFLNDDMYCCPDWDLPLWTTLQQQSDLHFFLSATMIEPYASGNPAVLAPHDFGQHPQQFREQDLLQSLPHLQKDDWNGASWPPNLVHVSLWDAVGGYSEEYSPGFYSDPDFAFKLWALGVRRFIGLGDSRVYHFGRQSTRRIAAGKGKRIFLKKWGITPSVFYQHYLRMGSPFDGPLPEPTVSWSLRWARLRCWVKSFL
ncbi:MAG: glycosyltransferase family A protein, partial [Bacteroidota bacterium]